MQKTIGEKVLYRIDVIYLCSLFLGLPLILNEGYFNISATRSLFYLVTSSLLCIMAMVIALITSIRARKIQFTLNALDMAVMALGITATIAAVMSRYPMDVWLGKNSRLQGAVVVLVYVLVYLVISRSLFKLDRHSYPIRFLAIGFVLAAGLALLHDCNIDPTGLFERMQSSQRHLFISTLGNINFFSAYVSLCVPTFVVLATYAEKWLSRICWGFVLMACGVASVLTCSESFVIGFVVFVAVAPFFFFDNARHFLKLGFSLLTVLLSALAFFYIHNALPKSIYHPAALVSTFLSGPWVWLVCFLLIALSLLAYFRPSSLRLVRWVYFGIIVAAVLMVVVLITKANTQGADVLSKFFVFNDRWGSGRGKVYRLCVEVMQDFSVKDWLFGVGPESLQSVMRQRGITYIDQAHSEYLQTLITTGVLGLLSQLSVMAMTVMVVIRRARHNPLALALFMGLVAYWAQASVNIAQPFTTPLAYAFVAVIGSVYKHPEAENAHTESESKIAQRL